MRRDGRFVIAVDREPVARNLRRAKADGKLSRSAGSPALPTAITTRPQLASSPAMAVLTSGELATASPTRRALSSLTAPVTRDFDELLRTFAVAHHKMRKLAANILSMRPQTHRRPRH